MVFFMPVDAVNGRAVIFANGEIKDDAAARAILRPEDTLIAADGGLHHLRRLGLAPSVLIGDLDSVSPDEIPPLEAVGVAVLRYPVDKDETDLELAIAYALKEGHRSIVVVGALGGRLDQTLGNLFLLTGEAADEAALCLDDGHEEVFLIRGVGTICGRCGDTVSLIPFGGPVTGILTAGLRYPLTHETLYPQHTRGVSNVMLSEQATVEIASGQLLIVHTRAI
jgi:thiamine pyrophosphokinase